LNILTNVNVQIVVFKVFFCINYLQHILNNITLLCCDTHSAATHQTRLSRYNLTISGQVSWGPLPSRIL